LNVSIYYLVISFNIESLKVFFSYYYEDNLFEISKILENMGNIYISKGVHE